MKESARPTQVASHFDDLAERYEGYTIWLNDRDINLPFLQHISRHEGLKNGIDLGGGTGHLATLAAKSGGTWTVIDVSERMLSLVPPSISTVQADIENLPIRDRSVDMALARSVLWYVDIKTALQEAARVLRQGGLLIGAEKVLGRYHPHESWYREVNAVRSPLKVGVTGERELASKLLSTGFSIHSGEVVRTTYDMSLRDWVSKCDTIDSHRQQELTRLARRAPRGLVETYCADLEGERIRIATDWYIYAAVRI